MPRFSLSLISGPCQRHSIHPVLFHGCVEKNSHSTAGPCRNSLFGSVLRDIEVAPSTSVIMNNLRHRSWCESTYRSEVSLSVPVPFLGVGAAPGSLSMPTSLTNQQVHEAHNTYLHLILLLSLANGFNRLGNLHYHD